MEAHLSTVWLWQGFARNDFEQEHQFETITEIIFNTFNRCSSFAQMAVAPGSEGLRKLIKTLIKIISYQQDYLLKLEYARVI